MPGETTSTLTSNTSSILSEFIYYNGKTYFSAYDEVNGTELWVTDVIPVISVGETASTSPSDLTIFNNKLYFSVDNSIMEESSG